MTGDKVEITEPAENPAEKPAPAKKAPPAAKKTDQWQPFEWAKTAQ